jgi:hypothetical protein
LHPNGSPGGNGGHPGAPGDGGGGGSAGNGALPGVIGPTGTPDTQVSSGGDGGAGFGPTGVVGPHGIDGTLPPTEPNVTIPRTVVTTNDEVPVTIACGTNGCAGTVAIYTPTSLVAAGPGTLTGKGLPLVPLASLRFTHAERIYVQLNATAAQVLRLARHHRIIAVAYIRAPHTGARIEEFVIRGR